MEVALEKDNKQTVLVVGATSSMAQALCQSLAKAGYHLTLVGRDAMELELVQGDIKSRYDSVCKTVLSDFLDPTFSAPGFIESTGSFDHVVIAVGEMGSSDPTDIANLGFTMLINYIIPAQIATAAALVLAERKASSPPARKKQKVEKSAKTSADPLLSESKPLELRPTIMLISSVAGDRGRQSNYAYGSAKAAFSTFASGLRNRFFKQGIHVMTIKPGFVDTPMTWSLKSKLIASREVVAEHILKAFHAQKDVVYVPSIWRWIMLIIRHIPEAIFKKLSL